MKELNLSQVHQVSGGDAVFGLCLITAASLAMSIYNAGEIERLNRQMRYEQKDLDFVYSWIFYHDAQLSMLPHYAEVSAMNFDQVFDMSY